MQERSEQKMKEQELQHQARLVELREEFSKKFRDHADDTQHRIRQEAEVE